MEDVGCPFNKTFGRTVSSSLGSVYRTTWEGESRFWFRLGLLISSNERPPTSYPIDGV